MSYYYVHQILTPHLYFGLWSFVTNPNLSRHLLLLLLFIVTVFVICSK